MLVVRDSPPDQAIGVGAPTDRRVLLDRRIDLLGIEIQHSPKTAAAVLDPREDRLRDGVHRKLALVGQELVDGTVAAAGRRRVNRQCQIEHRAVLQQVIRRLHPGVEAGVGFDQFRHHVISVVNASTPRKC